MLDLWVKIPVAFTNDLPTSRPYSPIEAAFSFERDRLFNKKKSIRDYAKIWSWSKSKVDRFIKEFDIQDEDDQAIKTNQNRGTNAGQMRDNNETPKEPENSMLQDCLGQMRDNSGTNAGHILIREREEIKEESPSAGPKILFDTWNEIATGTQLPTARVLTKKRERKCHSRLKERSAEEWQDIFRTVSATPFLCGQNDRRWKADFDWIISSEDPAIKILEGKYTNSRDESSRYSMFAGA